jgi:hypothetical protein
VATVFWRSTHPTNNKKPRRKAGVSNQCTASHYALAQMGMGQQPNGLQSAGLQSEGLQLEGLQLCCVTCLLFFCFLGRLSA